MLAGMAILLLGLRLMSQHLETAFGSKMRLLLDKVGSNRFASFGIGAGVTAAIQSSSATTAMVVGLVNTGMITLYQATNIIIGANFGTTITALLVSLQGVSLISPILASLSLIGVLIILFSKKRLMREIGGVVLGFGLIFAGLFFMSGYMQPLLTLPAVSQAISGIANPFLLILIGIVVTALVQSSTATIAILISLGSVLSLPNAMFIVLGANLGTSVTAVIVALGARTNARRAAYVHVFFNVFGLILFSIVLFAFPNAYRLLEALAPESYYFQISLFHVIFNLVTGVTLIFLSKLIVKFFTAIIKDKTDDKSAVLTDFVYIDRKMQPTPSVVMTNVRKEISYMGHLAYENLKLAIESILATNFDRIDEFAQREKNINFLNREITKYLVELTSVNMSSYEVKVIGTYFHTVTDIERIGDYAENIMEYTEAALIERIGFSDKAIEEIRVLEKMVLDQLSGVMSAFEAVTVDTLMQLKALENEIDEYTIKLNDTHIERMSAGLCLATASSRFLALISDLERIADHAINIAIAMKDYCQIQ